MIHVKRGVFFHPDSFRWPEFWRMAYVAQWMAPDGYEVTITSGADGDHLVNSAHYSGHAIDLRTRDFPRDKSTKIWAKRIQDGLGNCYFVLREPNHLHIQWNALREKKE